MSRTGGSARQSLFGSPPSTEIQHGSGRELDPQALFEKMLQSPKEWTEEDMQRELEGEDGKSTVKHLNPEFSPEAIDAGNATSEASKHPSEYNPEELRDWIMSLGRVARWKDDKKKDKAAEKIIDMGASRRP